MIGNVPPRPAGRTVPEGAMCGFVLVCPAC